MAIDFEGKCMIITDLKEMAACVLATGSRVICNPAPTDTDEDFALYISESAEWIMEVADDLGYERDGGEAYDSLLELDDGGFVSFRKGNVNYIVTTSQDLWDRFEIATGAAKALNLVNKEDRIKLFQYILYEADFHW